MIGWPPSKDDPCSVCGKKSCDHLTVKPCRLCGKKDCEHRKPPSELSFVPHDVLAMPEKVELVHDIRAAISQRATEAWLAWHRACEARNRDHPHSPGRGGKMVRPTWDAISKHSGYVDLCEERDQKFTGIAQPVIDAASQHAKVIFEAELVSCPCSGCTRNR